jgi:polyhydroxybutyrate depolymerase
VVSLVGRVRTHASGPVLAVLVVLLAGALLFTGTTVAGSQEQPPAPLARADGPCSTPAPGVIGTSERTMTFGGVERRYLVHVPATYDGSRRLPVVVLFHGLGRSPEAMLRMTRFDQLADTENAVVVAPQALGAVPAWRFREVKGVEGADLPFVDALLDDVEATTCTDESRRYAVGFSNGGALTMALACRDDDRFAAYASVAGPYRTPDCDRAPARPLVVLHGLKDTVVPPGGARTRIGTLPSVVATTERWARQNGCRPAVRTRPAKGVTHLVHAPCAGGADVEAWFLSRGKHRWPGGGAPAGTRETPRTAPAAGDVDATQVIWDFVRTHSAPRETR